MLGSQRPSGNADNPFNDYQQFFLSLFANVHAPDDDGYVKGENDNMHFKNTIVLDDVMLSNPAIVEKTQGKKYVKLSDERTITGFFKSISVVKEEINKKPTKQIQITLFDPNATYLNPWEKIDTQNPKNGTVTGAVYKLKSAFTLKSKELLNKLASAEFDKTEPITISIVNANLKDADGKFTNNQLVINGKKVFNVLVKQGETVLYSRFGDAEKNSFIKNDVLNQEFNEILESRTGDLLRVMMDDFFENFINKKFKQDAHNGLFLSKLHEMGYDLVADGMDRDEQPKLKYVRLGDHQNASSILGVDVTAKSFVPEIEETMPTTDDDLPF